VSDIVLGALIGIGGAVVGSIITGYFSYKNTRLQVNTRREELNQQLSHQEREARLHRLIDARKDYLLSLRKTLGEWMECSNKAVAMLVRVGEAHKEKANSLELQQESKTFEAVSNQSAELTSQLEILRGQVSDSNLDNLIEAAKKAQYDAGLEMMPLVRFFNNPQNADTSSIEAALEKYQSIIQGLRNHLLRINKRIEELLSGDLST
jgi:hypothetical protein